MDSLALGKEHDSPTVSSLIEAASVSHLMCFQRMPFSARC